jgi:Leucine-rich repeat (LRR) protein
MSHLSAPANGEARHAILMQAIPHWLRDATPAKRSALGEVSANVPDWYKNASAAQHAELKRLNGEAWTRQNQVDKALAGLKSPQTFGADLLQPALKRQYGVDLDVRSTWLQLYVPLTLAGFRVQAGASRTWRVSVLEAALHNFEPDEAQPDAYERSSGFSTQPNAAGHFQSLPAIDAKISIAQFATLCRDLDIGGRYQRYLDDYLGLDNPVAKSVLQHKVEQSLGSALNFSLYIARLKDDIPQAAYDAVHNLINPGQHRTAWVAHELVIMSSRLTGIVLFSQDLDASREAVPVVVYIPDDPQHPIKQYASAQAFIQALTARLRASDFQHFFSRFVGHADLGRFFADLTGRLSQVTWHRHTPGDPLPSWREIDTDRPNLQFRGIPIKQPLLPYLHQMKVSKLLADACSRAVPTASANSNARWKRWDLVQKIASALLQVVALIATPFVPPLGLLMLGYTAYQLLDEAFEGVIDWAEGQVQEAFGHTMGFFEQLIQLGLFATGIPIAQGILRKVLPSECQNFLDGLTPVTTPGGERLWKPDLEPYRLKQGPPTGARPDEKGLYRFNGQHLLQVGDDYYAVRQDPTSQRYFVLHPDRASAYQPQVISNGQGAWITELERPLSWDSTTLMRRLGYPAEGLDDVRLQQARSVSGTHDNALRQMHHTGQTPPPLLADTLKRFKIDQALQDFITQLNSDDPRVYGQADVQTQLQILTSYGLWPASKTLRFLDAHGKTQWAFPGRPDASVVQVHESQLKKGDLLSVLVESLDESERKALLEEPADQPAPHAPIRAGALRKKIARLAHDKRFSLFDSRYRSEERTPGATLQKIIDAAPEPGLPVSVAQELLASATGAEWQAIDQGKVPVRIAEQAAAAQLDVRTTRAYEGLYLDAVDNPDTHRLALLSLERLPGWSTRLRLEVRQYRSDGPLLDAIGAEDAPLKRIVVHTETGRYTPVDEKGPVFGDTDFFTAILQAIPDSQRDALNIHIGQGEHLRQAIGEHVLDRERLRTLLSEDTYRKPTFDPTVMRLHGGMEGYQAAGPSRPPAADPQPTLEQRAHHLLPSLPAEQIADLIQTLENRPGGALATLITLQAEYNKLDTDLAVWEHMTPTFHPITEALLTPREYQYARRNRALWAHEVRRGWRQETAIDHYHDQLLFNGHKLQLTLPIYGELPRLTARFEHISLLELKGQHTALAINDFVQLFPRLRHLNISQFYLGGLAPSIAQLSSLDALILSDCNITLTEETRVSLGSMTRLTTLDLYNNPLGLTPSVTQMAHLQHLDLSYTGIRDLPPGLLNRPQLALAVLANNQIRELPMALFELPVETSRTFDLSGNPLSGPTLERVKGYYQRTGGRWDIDAPVAEIEKARRLYPTLSDDDINHLIFDFPGNLEAGRAALAQLEIEYPRIRQTLTPWADDEQVSIQERTYRSLFVDMLEAGWRRETELDTHAPAAEPARFTLNLPYPISGDIPALNTPFTHVSSLTLTGNASALQASAFLRSFPRLERLSIERCTLVHLPKTLPQLEQLTHLRLDRCVIELNPASAQALSGMTHLQHLDLANNRLVWLPDFNRLTALTSLSLSNTGLREIPPALLAGNIVRTRVDLSHNAIEQIPDQGFQLPPSVSAAFDLSDNPLSRQTLARLKTYCQSTGEHWNAQPPQLQLQKLQALYPSLDSREAGRLYFQLPGDLDAAAPEITRLGREYHNLQTQLQTWALEVPSRDPLLDTVLDEGARAEEQIRRLGFKDVLERCWRREGDLDDSNGVTRHSQKLVFHGQLLGDMPMLSARFEHVSLLEIIGDGTNQQVDGLLRCFPNLASLTLERHTLRDIPATVFGLRRLRYLKLAENHIRLTRESKEQLSRLIHLEYLDLSDNPLIFIPDMRNLGRLVSIYLHNCGLTHVPEGVFSLGRLRVLDLSDNEIVDVPSDLLEMPLPLNDDSDLSGNPLSEHSIEVLRDYYRQTGYELGVEEAMFDEFGVELIPPGSPIPMEE